MSPPRRRQDLGAGPAGGLRRHVAREAVEKLLRTAGVALMCIALAGLDTVVLVLSLAFTAALVAHLARYALASMGTGEPPDEQPVPASDGARGPVPPPTLTVSVLVPLRDEEAEVRRLARSLLSLDYPRSLLQVIVIDDGSLDHTGDLLRAVAARTSRMTLLQRVRDAGGGKAGALNDALHYASGEIVVVLDADQRPAPDLLRRVVQHFVDPTVGIVQGHCVAVRGTLLRDLAGWDEAVATADTDLAVRVALCGYRIHRDELPVDSDGRAESPRTYWRERNVRALGYRQLWRRYGRALVMSRQLSRRQRGAAVLGLLASQLPVMTAVGLALLVVWLVHPVRSLADGHEALFVLWPLLFAGPAVEVAAGAIRAALSGGRLP